MKLTKKLTISIVGLAALTTLAACGSSGKASSNAGSKTGTITIWTSTTGPDFKAYQAKVNEYNSTNPSYKVKVLSMTADTLKSKLTTAGKSGVGLPDIADLASEQLPYYKDLNLLDNWDSLIKGSAVKSGAYVPASWKVGTLSGKQYGIPETMGTWVMYYNKDLLQKLDPAMAADVAKTGIVTYADVEKIGPKAKAAGVYATSNDWGSQNFMNIYLQMGGKWRTDGKFNIDNSIAKAAWEEWKKLNSEGYLVPNGTDATKSFMNGKVVFNPEGTWMLNQYQGIKNFKWGETLTLQWDANNIIQCSGSGQYAIFKTKTARSKNLDKGMVAYMAWLQKNQLSLLQSGANPTALAMLNNSDYKKLPQSFLLTNPTAQKAIKINTDAGISPFMTAFDAKNWDMLTGKAAIPGTMNQIQQTVDAQMGN